MIDTQTQSILLELLNFSSRRNIKLFVVGGTLRDHFLQQKITDIDLTGKDIAKIATAFAKSLNLTSIPLDKTLGRSTTRIILSRQKHLDCTDMQGSRIEEDLSQRDFTMNAMGQELPDFLASKNGVIDLFGGREDLDNKTIQAVSGSVFVADPLRMLRAFRFAATLGFTIESHTLKKIFDDKEMISKTAAERIWQELLLLFGADNTGDSINLMKETGLLSCLTSITFTEWENVLTYYNRLEHIFLNPHLYFPKYAPKIISSKISLIKLSLLLINMDINLSIENKKRKDFGTPKTFETLKTLKASNSEIAYICRSIQNFQLFSRPLSSSPNESSLYDLCVKAGDQLVAGILLQVCTLAFPENPERIENEKLAPYEKLLDFYFMRYLPILEEKALMNGNDIMKLFNIPPSPVLANVLENIQRAQILGEIKTFEEAKSLAAKILKSQE